MCSGRYHQSIRKKATRRFFGDLTQNRKLLLIGPGYGGRPRVGQGLLMAMDVTPSV